MTVWYSPIHHQQLARLGWIFHQARSGVSSHPLSDPRFGERSEETMVCGTFLDVLLNLWNALVLVLKGRKYVVIRTEPHFRTRRAIGKEAGKNLAGRRIPGNLNESRGLEQTGRGLSYCIIMPTPLQSIDGRTGAG